MTPQDHLATLVSDLLAGKRIDVLCFVDQLLLLADTVGEIQCVPLDEGLLRFTIPAEPPLDVGLDHARGKLRMICARLAVLCAGGAQPTPYGGQGNAFLHVKVELEDGKTFTNQIVLKVQFTNSATAVGFTIQGTMPRLPVSRKTARLNIN